MKIQEDKKLFILLRAGISIFILLAGVGGFFLAQYLKGDQTKKITTEAIKNLTGIPVIPGPVRLSISGYGKVQTAQDIILSSEVKGRIVEKRDDLKAGVLVKKGEVLLRIDKSDYIVALNQAEADIKQLTGEKAIIEQFIIDTEKQLKLLRRVQELQTENYKRIKGLYDKQASYRTELEQAEVTMQTQAEKVISTSATLAKSKLQLETTDAQIRRAIAEKNLAQNNILRCVIKSPIRGRIKVSYIDRGEYVNSGDKLFELADDSTLEIPVSLGADEVAKTLPIKAVHHNNYSNWFTNAAGIPVTIDWIESSKASSWKGKVVRLEGFNSDSGTFKFTVSPTEPLSEKHTSFPLIDGMFCKVTFLGKTIQNAVRVPWISVQTDGDIYIVNAKGILESRPADIYSSNKNFLVVTSGLSQGEHLIVQKLPRGVVNGMKVKVVPPSPGKFDYCNTNLAPIDKHSENSQSNKKKKISKPQK